jgi:hypothetical protein
VRRIAALLALFVLSLSRIGAMAEPSGAHVRSIGGIVAHELAAPAVRLDAHTLREAAPREPARVLSHWLPMHASAELRALGEPTDARRAVQHADRVTRGEWRGFTYDATAPPRLS